MVVSGATRDHASQRSAASQHQKPTSRKRFKTLRLHRGQAKLPRITVHRLYHHNQCEYPKISGSSPLRGRSGQSSSRNSQQFAWARKRTSPQSRKACVTATNDDAHPGSRFALEPSARERCLIEAPWDAWRAHQPFQRVGVLCREAKGFQSLDLCIAGAGAGGGWDAGTLGRWDAGTLGRWNPGKLRQSRTYLSRHGLLHPLAQRINNIHGTIFPDPNVMCEPKLPIVVAIATGPGNELHNSVPSAANFSTRCIAIAAVASHGHS
jgi:hypothetical protein